MLVSIAAEVSIHQALAVVDKLVEKIEPERLNLGDAERLEKAAARIRERFAKKSPYTGLPVNVDSKCHGPYLCGPNCGICEANTLREYHGDLAGQQP